MNGDNKSLKLFLPTCCSDCTMRNLTTKCWTKWTVIKIFAVLRKCERLSVALWHLCIPDTKCSLTPPLCRNPSIFYQLSPIYRHCELESKLNCVVLHVAVCKFYLVSTEKLRTCHLSVISDALFVKEQMSKPWKMKTFLCCHSSSELHPPESKPTGNTCHWFISHISDWHSFNNAWLVLVYARFLEVWRSLVTFGCDKGNCGLWLKFLEKKVASFGNVIWNKLLEFFHKGLFYPESTAEKDAIPHVSMSQICVFYALDVSGCIFRTGCGVFHGARRFSLCICKKKVNFFLVFFLFFIWCVAASSDSATE